MNKLKAAFLILLVALSASTPLAFSLVPVRHINPGEIPEEPLLSKGLMTFYVAVIDLSVLERYSEAAGELQKSNLFYVPENLKFTISRFNELLSSVTNRLNLLQSHLRRAEALIAVAKLQEANAELKEASNRLREAEDAISDLESSASQLAKTLGTRPKPLLDKIAELKAVANRYAHRIEELLATIEELTPGPGKALVTPELTIQANSSIAWLGQWLLLNGSLIAVGGGLRFKTIHLYLEGREAGTALTDGNGDYSIELQVPYLYKPSTTVFALFKLSDLDVEKYSPCVSETLSLKLLYYEPKLSARLLQKALPGRSLTVHGSLSSLDKPLSNYEVKLSVFGLSESTLTDRAGNFKFNVSVPRDLLGGSWLAVFESPPSGLIGPASTSLRVEIARIQAGITVEAPSMVLGGSKVTLQGRIELEEDVSENLTVVGHVGEWTGSTWRVGNGTFSIEVYIPLNALVGRYVYSVSMSSDEPWFSSSVTEGSILIISPLALAMPVLAVSMATLTVSRVVPRRRRLEEAEKPLTPVVVKAPPQPPSAEGLAALYWSAVRIVSTETGVEMVPSHTVREYVRAVADGLKGGLASFERLSLAYERLIYARWISLKEEDEAKLAFKELQSLFEIKVPKVPLEAQKKAQIFCDHCGRDLPPEAKYCDRCGRAVEEKLR